MLVVFATFLLYLDAIEPIICCHLQVKLFLYTSSRSTRTLLSSFSLPPVRIFLELECPVFIFV